MKVIIYSKDNCGFCEEAKTVCNIKNIEFEEKKLGVDFTTEELLEKFPSARTFPQIIVDDNHVGGYKEFKEIVDG